MLEPGHSRSSIASFKAADYQFNTKKMEKKRPELAGNYQFNTKTPKFQDTN